MQLPYTFGRYTLLKKLANGGMAEIFLARLSGVEDFSKLVAIKKILPEILKDKQFTNMLRDEAKALVRLQHKNVVRIHELDEEGGQLFISMEYVQGVDLSRLLKDIICGRAKLPLKLTIYIVSQILEGLDFVHRLRCPRGKPLSIVHRDISPPNILCSWNGEIKIADFGIAKGNHRNHATAANQLKGKYSYMSPEQALGRRIDHRTDVFAAGIILFELISKERLFEGSSDFKVIEKVRRARIPFTKISEAPPELKEVCCTALSRDPDDRYQSAGEFLSALNGCSISHGSFMSGLDFGNYLRGLYPDDVSDPGEELPPEVHSKETGRTCVMTSVQSTGQVLKRMFIASLIILLCFILPASASKQPEPLDHGDW
jgi:serine/threonine protein kinase